MTADSRNTSLLQETDERVDYERRRLPVRLALLGAPVLLLVAFGGVAVPAAIVVACCAVIPYTIVRLLLYWRPALVARYLLVLRLTDICVFYIALYNTHFLLLSGHAVVTDFWDCFFVIAVCAAAPTHGWTGTVLITIGSSIAILVERLVLASRGYMAFVPSEQIPTVLGYALFFIVVGSFILHSMETSGATAARRERGLALAVNERAAMLEETTRQLRLANEELLRLDELRSNFLTNASHELRTPLTSLRAFAEFLRDPDLDAASRAEFIEIINVEVLRLTRLVSNLLNMTRIQSGAVVWHKRPVDLQEQLRGVFIMMRPLAEEKGLVLELDVTDDVGSPHTDEDGLRQVMVNLVDNAIKFTGMGEVCIWARNEDGNVRIGVKDSGPGMTPDEQAHAFVRFYQAGDILTEKPGGSGLGLAIAKEIVEQNGGTIEVQSILGEGSVFSFTLAVA